MSISVNICGNVISEIANEMQCNVGCGGISQLSAIREICRREEKLKAQ
jgi:hypothetical protein